MFPARRAGVCAGAAGVVAAYGRVSRGYALPRLRAKFEPAAPPTSQPAVSKVVEPGQALVDQTKSIAAAREIIERARAGGVKMIVALHLEADEVNATPQPGHAAFIALLDSMNMKPVELGDAFRTAIARGEQPYRDIIHPNAVGANIIAETLLPEIKQALLSPATAPPPTTAAAP